MQTLQKKSLHVLSLLQYCKTWLTECLKENGLIFRKFILIGRHIYFVYEQSVLTPKSLTVLTTTISKPNYFS